MQYDLIGVHVDNVDFFKEAFTQGVRTFQMFLSSPTQWEVPKYQRFLEMSKYLVKNKSSSDNVNIVIHLPFIFTLIKETHKAFILKYCLDIDKKMSFMVDKYGINIYLVSHCGAYNPELSYEENIKELSYISQEFYRQSSKKIKFTYENDPGSKKSTKIGVVKNLLQLQGNYKNVYITYDTEHAYADGDDLTDKTYLNKVLSSASLVHLNSIPYFVKQGSHLDRHSETYINSGKLQLQLLRIVHFCLENNIPMILERNENISLEDRAWLIKTIEDKFYAAK